MKFICFTIVMLFLGGCNSGDKNAAVISSEIDAIDSSAIMNNATRLPTDSTITGVTH